MSTRILSTSPLVGPALSELAARCRELELLCKKAIPDDVSGRLKEINQGIQEVRCGLETHFNCSLAP